MRGGVFILIGTIAASACGNGKKPPPTASGAGDSIVTPVPDTKPAASDQPASSAAVPAPPSSRAKLHLTLRSTPPGATATVDGKAVGSTPVLWDVEGDGKVHEFDFLLPGYTTYRLRFQPVRDGVIHAPLTPIAGPADAGE